MTWKDIKYFTQKEFDDASVAGSGANMSIGFVFKLDVLRAKLGFPLEIHSGYRTPEHNAEVGGVPDSAHTKGLAADIACTESQRRYEIVRAAISLGFQRIGIGSSFIHLDVDASKDQQVIWLYPVGKV